MFKDLFKNNVLYHHGDKINEEELEKILENKLPKKIHLESAIPELYYNLLKEDFNESYYYLNTLKFYASSTYNTPVDEYGNQFRFYEYFYIQNAYLVRAEEFVKRMYSINKDSIIWKITNKHLVLTILNELDYTRHKVFKLYYHTLCKCRDTGSFSYFKNSLNDRLKEYFDKVEKKYMVNILSSLGITIYEK